MPEFCTRECGVGSSMPVAEETAIRGQEPSPAFPIQGIDQIPGLWTEPARALDLSNSVRSRLGEVEVMVA